MSSISSKVFPFNRIGWCPRCCFCIWGVCFIASKLPVVAVVWRRREVRESCVFTGKQNISKRHFR
jgi:hypothetical protein